MQYMQYFLVLECTCIDYVNGVGQGNCLKLSTKLNNLPYCYVKQPSGCRDVINSSYVPGKEYSAQACHEGM